MTFKVGGVRVIPNTDGSQVNSLELANIANTHAVKLKSPDSVPADVSITVGLMYLLSGLPDSPTASQKVFYLPMPVAGNFSANFAGAATAGNAGTNPTSTASYTVKKNSSTIGTISISTGGAFTFATTGGSAQSFAANDVISIVAPASPDATLANVTITLQAART